MNFYFCNISASINVTKFNLTNDKNLKTHCKKAYSFKILYFGYEKTVIYRG